MFIAQLKNKFTRSEEDMEDLLTSNVFGIWRYLPPQLGLEQFLGTARRQDGTVLMDLGEITEIKLDFWPWYKRTDTMRGGQPDILIEVANSTSQKYLFLIESKFLSDKSDVDPTPYPSLPSDQLAREMQILRDVANSAHIENYALIYLTAHTCFPKQDIQEAICDLFVTTGEGSVDHFYWTSWRELPAILTDGQLLLEAHNLALGYERILTDLNIIIHRLGLTFFEGFTSVPNIGLGLEYWQYENPQVVFRWLPINIPIHKFHETKVSFNWVSPYRILKIPWRFC